MGNPVSVVYEISRPKHTVLLLPKPKSIMNGQMDRHGQCNMPLNFLRKQNRMSSTTVMTCFKKIEFFLCENVYSLTVTFYMKCALIMEICCQT